MRPIAWCVLIGAALFLAVGAIDGDLMWSLKSAAVAILAMGVIAS